MTDKEKLDRISTFLVALDRYAGCKEKEGHWREVVVLRTNIKRMQRVMGSS
jgi:hypothetical protein